MPVFLSHRTSDAGLAKGIYDYLTGQRIECFLDNMDDELRRAGEREVTNIIVNRLHDCTNLLAIVTPNTEGSWWVPFEIGVAREAPRMISTFSTKGYDLPEYLKEWPVLRTPNDLALFAQAYNRVGTVKLSALKEGKEYYGATPTNMVDSFHRGLKASLSQ